MSGVRIEIGKNLTANSDFPTIVFMVVTRENFDEGGFSGSIAAEQHPDFT